MLRLKVSKFLLALTFLFFGLLVDKALSAGDSGVYTYIFHLWYDKGAIRQDSDFKFPFDLVAKKYSPTQSASSLSGEISSIKGELLTKFVIPLNLIPADGKGKISVEAPYFPNAKKVIFRSPSGSELLSLDLAPSGPVCNEDGNCNANFGESSENCLSDCPKAKPDNIVQQQSEDIQKKESSKITITLLLSGLVLIVAIAAWIFLRKK